MPIENHRDPQVILALEITISCDVHNFYMAPQPTCGPLHFRQRRVTESTPGPS
jgi:hypothetical protein